MRERFVRRTESNTDHRLRRACALDLRLIGTLPIATIAFKNHDIGILSSAIAALHDNRMSVVVDEHRSPGLHHNHAIRAHIVWRLLRSNVLNYAAISVKNFESVAHLLDAIGGDILAVDLRDHDLAVLNTQLHRAAGSCRALRSTGLLGRVSWRFILRHRAGRQRKPEHECRNGEWENRVH